MTAAKLRDTNFSNTVRGFKGMVVSALAITP